MSTSNRSIAASLSTNANMQGFVTNFHTDITGFGWVQTSDTGQANPATITTAGGYLVYRTNDGLANIYLRIDFLAGGSAQPQWKFQAGYTTDGAGNLTGQKSTQMSLNTNSNTGYPVHLYLAGSTSWFSVNFNPDAGGGASVMCCFSIERDKDTTGADVATGFNVISYCGNDAHRQQFVPSSGTIPQQITSGLASAHPPNTSTAVVGANTLVSPSIPIKETGGGNPSIGAMIYTNADYTNGVTTTVTSYGVTHSYIVTPASVALPSSANFKSMWRYE